ARRPAGRKAFARTGRLRRQDLRAWFSWLIRIETPRAAEAQVVHGVARLQAAAKPVAHERREISVIIRAFGAAPAERLPVQTGVAARIPRDHGRAEVGHPLPNEAVEIMNAKPVGASPAHDGERLRRGRGVPRLDLADELGIVRAIRAREAGRGRVLPLG